MKEITDIIRAYERAVKENKKTALATVVRVEGSSYRRPGARMLITEDGQLTGAISGGCLEGDALRKALSAIIQQETKLITYDTSDEEDAKIGVQLGCNGIVHILFEPVKADEVLNPVAFLRELAKTREAAVLAVLFSHTSQNQKGTSLLYRKAGYLSKVSPAINEAITQAAAGVMDSRKSGFEEIIIQGQPFMVFLELINPPVALVIAGAGNDAQPLAEIAYLVGWEVTIADGRPTHASFKRFPNAARVLVAKPHQLLSQLIIDEHTAFVLMTHNYNYDLEFLGYLLKTSAAYIGTLGPKKKLIRMLEELNEATTENKARIYGPVGLDIGAETAEEIAISVIAEIKSAFSGASAGFLKEKQKPIHCYEKNL